MSRLTKTMMLAVGLGCLMMAACSQVTPEQVQSAAAAKRLSGDDIKSDVVGSTISGYSSKGPRYEETYLADGTIHGIWAGKDKYTGKWTLQGDKLCADYDGSDDSDWCSNLAVNGDKLYWLKDDGTASSPDRPATLAAGNPDSL